MSKKSKNTSGAKNAKSAKNAKPADSAKPDASAVKPDPDLVPLSEAMKKPANGSKKAKSATGAKAPAKEAGGAKAPKKLSCLDAAAQVLKSEGKAMTCKQLIDAMFNAKLWHSDAPTPAATLYSAILREMTNKKDSSRFAKTDRGLFEVKA